MLLISNGRVLDPASGTDAPRDILLDGDRIAAVAPHGQLAARAQGAEIFKLPIVTSSACAGSAAQAARTAAAMITVRVMVWSPDDAAPACVKRGVQMDIVVGIGSGNVRPRAARAELADFDRPLG